MDSKVAQARTREFLTRHRLPEGDGPALSPSDRTFSSGGKEWQVLVRGGDPHAVIAGLPLIDVSVDVDPIECA